MNKYLKNILEANKELSGWKLKDIQTQSTEVFLVRKNINMIRNKKVHDMELTVYTESENGKYIGSASIFLYDTMTEPELKDAVNNAIQSSKLVKNEYYSIAQPQEFIPVKLDSYFDHKSSEQAVKDIMDALYSKDTKQDVYINSCEIFLEKTQKILFNSNGIEYKDDFNKCYIEYVITARSNGDEIELIDKVEFSDFNKTFIENLIEDKFEIAMMRLKSGNTPNLVSCDIILRDNAVKDFFGYYIYKANAMAIYEKTSDFVVGKNVVKNSLSDKLSITLDPYMAGSTFSSQFDDDGVLLKKTQILKDGVVEKIWGNLRFSQYVNTQCTGNIGNFCVTPGKSSYKEMVRGKILEIHAFSDFQLDEVTGDFGGEIRLAYLHEDGGMKVFTGGSISGNINFEECSVILSEETVQINNYFGPKYIKLTNVSVTGE
ncbi:MAG TPA: metallopeptidase TldD-related protein [Petrotogaceae bacterium]|nr:metallopeptidase TldD-related protein [Petrotogaceae bacterium]